jgi:putative transposase
MRLIDEQYTRTPFCGVRRLTAWLNTQGHRVKRKRVFRLMNRMGIEAIYSKKRLSRADAEAKNYPYLLKRVVIDRPDQAWATDITYIRMRQGFRNQQLFFTELSETVHNEPILAKHTLCSNKFPVA